MQPSSDEARQSLRHQGGEDEQIRAFAVGAARLLADRHFVDVLLFDVRGMNDMTDYILIASGTSDRQMRAVGREIEDLAGESGIQRYGHDEDAAATWVLVDFVDVVVHLFEPATRAHYDLEMMWDDAPRVQWQR